MNMTQIGIIKKLETVKNPDNEKSINQLQNAVGQNPAAARRLIAGNPELAVLIQNFPFIQILIETL